MSRLLCYLLAATPLLRAAGASPLWAGPGPGPSPSDASPPEWASLAAVSVVDSAAARLEYIERVRRAANCTAGTRLPLGPRWPTTASAAYGETVAAAVRTASVLNEVERHDGGVSLYVSLLRAVVVPDGAVVGALIVLDARPPTASYVYKRRDRWVATDAAADSVAAAGWYGRLRGSSPAGHPRACSAVSGRQSGVSGRYSVGGLREGAATTRGQAVWTQPYYDCEPAPGTWMVTVAVPFFACNSNQTVGFRGAVAIYIDLGQRDIDQCSDDAGYFAETHRCDQQTTQCVPLPGMGFRRGGYRCVCADGYYFPNPNASADYFSGADVESAYIRALLNGSRDAPLACLPCSKGCRTCVNGSRCVAEYDVIMRGVPLGIQSFCMTIAALMGFIVVRLRKTKVIKMSMWALLEIIIFGTLLLYTTVIIQYFEPTQMTCTLVPWLREIGFAIVYGALVLKIYRVLAEFQSRKAHCVHIRDRDLIKYLSALVLAVVCYMSAWSAITTEHARDGRSLVVMGTAPGRLSYRTCRSHWWEYVTEMGEFVFLCFGMYWSYCIRTAPSDYFEAKYVSWAIYNEAIVSTSMHIIRHVVWLTIHPDYVLLMYFIRCQMTVTVTLILIIGPKLWYVHRPPESSTYRTRAYSADAHESSLPESTKLRLGVSSNGDVDVGEMSLSEMDPEDIRAELRKLYTQLQVYKTKTMRKDNPHISKRRGGRKQTHRRFSLQAFHHKHRHHHEPRCSDFEHELSKTPEESTNSAEGVAISIAEESSAGECRTPTVTFRPGHKSMY